MESLRQTALAFGLAFAVGSAATFAAREAGSAPTEAFAQSPMLEPDPEPDPAARLALRVVPDAVAPAPGDLLERRLAALAQTVERRPRGGGLVDFDVEALGEDIREHVDALEGRAQVSVHVRDLATQHVLFDSYGDTPLVPASNAKLLTSSAAIDLLGPDYRFKTRLAMQEGTLYLVGEGDPMFHLDDLHAMAARLADASLLDTVERIVVDDTAFSPQRFGPGYATGGPGVAYQAPSGALSLNFNHLEIEVKAGRREVEVAVEPFNEHIEVRTKAKVSTRSNLDVRTIAEGDKTIVEVSGKLRRWRSTHVRRRVTDPGLFAGSHLATFVAELAERAPPPVTRGKVAPGSEVVVTHESDPLIEIVDDGLAYSNNLIAEQVMRTVAWRMTGVPGDWTHGREVLEGYWSALGHANSGLVVENGSGLSREGRMTTSELVDLISVAHRTDSGLIGVLPVAGEPGTMRTRLRLSGKRVRAKTGTLRGVSALSGVITSETGVPQVGFSIIINAEDDAMLWSGARKRAIDAIVMDVLRRLDRYEAARGLAG